MKLGFIGVGHMGGALARGLSVSEHELYLYDIVDSRAEALAEDIDRGSVFPASIEEIVAECDFIFLGVKPQDMPALGKKLSPLLGVSDAIVVSMAAEVTLAELRRSFEILNVRRFIRIMPNIPVSVGAGLTLWCPDEGLSRFDADSFEELMAVTGRIIRVSEEELEAGTALSGCAPAFAYMFIEALADGGVALGLDRTSALLAAEQTLLGAVKLAEVSGKHPAELKDSVCSPGGMTIAGVRSLERDAFRGAVIDAVLAAGGKK